jgi:hypothetical protein
MDAAILSMTEEGMGDTDIGEALGITRGAVMGRRDRILTRKENSDPTVFTLPERMPRDILKLAVGHAEIAKSQMNELVALSSYVDQMHEDLCQRIAQEVEVIYKHSADILRRLIGGVKNVKPTPAGSCAVKIRIYKEDV